MAAEVKFEHDREAAEPADMDLVVDKALLLVLLDAVFDVALTPPDVQGLRRYHLSIDDVHDVAWERALAWESALQKVFCSPVMLYPTGTVSLEKAVDGRPPDCDWLTGLIWVC